MRVEGSVLWCEWSAASFLALWPHEPARTFPEIPWVSVFQGIFVKHISSFFPSLLVSTQDQLEFQVFSRLSWSSHAQAFSPCLLEVSVSCFKRDHGKSAALWTLKGLKASQAAKKKQQLPWWNSNLQMSTSINLKQSVISTEVLFLTDSHHFPVKNCRYCQIKKWWSWVIFWDGVTLHLLLSFHLSRSILPFWWTFLMAVIDYLLVKTFPFQQPGDAVIY